MRMTLAAAALAVLAAAGAAHAGTPTEAEATCPLTGKTFKFWTTASYSTWGRALDGKPQGSWEFPLALPQCPDSRFPAFPDLTPAELARSRAMVETAEYKAAAREKPYYLLYFVLKRLDKPAEAYSWALLQATWQARREPETYRRYVDEFIGVADSFLEKHEPGEDIWWTMNLYAANLLRQSGRLEAAKARLDAVLKQKTPEGGMAKAFEVTARLIAERNTDDYAEEPERLKKAREAARH